MAIHAGEVLFDERGTAGDAVESVFRLLDSAEVRAATSLALGDLVVGVSAPIRDGVIEAGLPGVDPASYRPVTVEFKGTSFPAWIYIPGVTGPSPQPRSGPVDGPGDLLHRSILLVDIEDSDSRPDDVKWRHRAELRSIVFGAVADIGVAPEAFTAKDTGDGWRVLFLPEVAKNRLAGPLVAALVRRLVRYNDAAAPGERMRLRTVLHAGELLWDGSDFFGSALNEASWLVDSDELRECLALRAAPAVLMVSDVIYNGVVRHGYGEIDPERYEPRLVRAKKRDLATWVCWLGGDLAGDRA
ncbi:hypothetical protein BU204_24990 [Actinophytocola xanthii]|uniref:Uncharacterized protein n=1 Tax=Actinophytocola xanthii TaxID=1912961 RepID=A0A1Q8CKC9_9PSEU|nr:hypothetical protein BU204_24990 [Actinophytocola xanthii]